MIESHFKSFVFFSSIVDFVSVFINVSQKNKNLFNENKIIKIFFAINVDVINNVFNDTINNKYNYVFINKVIIRVNE